MTAQEKFVKFINDKDFNKFANSLVEILEYTKRQKDACDKAIETVRTWNKDEEIQKLKEQVDNLQRQLYNDFTLSVDENIAVEAWEEEHCKKYHRNGDTHCRLTYQFTPTALGVIGSVYCNNCGQEFTFRDV